MDARARLTPVDVAWITVAVLVLGLLIGPIYQLLNENAGELGMGEAYMLRMIPAALLIMAMVVIMAISVEASR